MASTHEITSIIVFIGYTSDVRDKKNRILKVIEAVNRDLQARAPFEFIAKTWEQVAPASGRPQSHLNPIVDECDIFMGVLGWGWGEPPGDSVFTSGFDEEFSRALSRAKESGNPRIMLYLSCDNQDMKKIAQDKLILNLAFRDARKKLKDVLFQEYEDDADLVAKIFEHLSGHVNLLRKERDEAVNEHVTRATEGQRSGVGEPLPGETDHSAIPPQVAEAFACLTDRKPDAASVETVRLASQRLYLFAQSKMSEHVTNELISNHVVNMLYLERAKLEFTDRERLLLYRALLGSDYAPGWYWFRDLEDDQVIESLQSCSRDPEDSVRKGALNRLADAGVSLSELPTDPSVFCLELLSEESDIVRGAAVNYIGLVVSQDDLVYLEPAIDESRSLSIGDGLYLRFMALSRGNTNKAFELLLSVDDQVPSKVLSEIPKIVGQTSVDVLRESLVSKHEGLAIVALSELLRRNQWTAHELRQCLTNSSRGVRFEAIKGLLGRGESIDPDEIRQLLEDKSSAWTMLLTRHGNPEDLVRLALEQEDSERLENRIQWLSIDSAIAYEIVTKRNGGAGIGRVRHDLETSFFDIESKWLDGAVESAMQTVQQDAEKAMIPPERIVGVLRLARSKLAASLQTRINEQTSEFIRNKFVAAALRVLLEIGSDDDVKYARQFVLSEDYDVKRAALDLINTKGVRTDVELILSQLGSAKGIADHEIAHCALHLDPGIDGSAPQLTSSGNVSAICEAIRHLAGCQDTVRAIELVRPLLYSPEHLVRRDAYIFVSKKSNAEVLDQVLQEYLNQPSYYYDVVCWFDRLLYAPSRLGNKYRKLVGLSV